MRRFRFYVDADDPRPFGWPPVGPYWISGSDPDDRFILIAYAPDIETLTDDAHWPDAEDVDDLGECEIVFTSRFPKPDWWSPAPTHSERAG